MRNHTEDKKNTTNEQPISLAGIDFKKLLSAFLKVKPDEEEKPAEKKENTPSKQPAEKKENTPSKQPGVFVRSRK